MRLETYEAPRKRGFRVSAIMYNASKPAKRHHIIPAQLLAQFGFNLPEDLAPSDPRRKNLWAYERAKAGPVKRRVETQCMEKRYFAESHGAESLSAEHENYLADHVEGPFNNILPLLENVLYEPSEIDRYSICRYLAYMFMRARPRKQASLRIAGETCKAAQGIAADRSKLRQLAAAHSVRLNAAVDLEALRISLLEVANSGGTSEGLQNHFVSSMGTTAQETIDDLLKLSLSLLISRGPTEFIVSDNPVITRVPIGNHLYNLGWGFRTPNVQVLMPISPRACLFLSRGRAARVQISNSDVRDVNAQVIQMSDRFVYSRTRSDDVQTLMARQNSRREYGKDAFFVPLAEDDLFYLMLQKAIFGNDPSVLIPPVQKSEVLTRIVRGQVGHEHEPNLVTQ
jgi:hypothetical protein